MLAAEPFALAAGPFTLATKAFVLAAEPFALATVVSAPAATVSAPAPESCALDAELARGFFEGFEGGGGDSAALRFSVGILGLLLTRAVNMMASLL